MENKEEKMPKATKELAERLDYINAEMEKLRDNTDQESEWRFMELGQEHCDLISSYDWYDEKFEENGKKGLKNVKGEIVVPAIYDNFGMPGLYYMNTSCVPAQLDGKMALVKRDGKGLPATEFSYQYIEPIPYSMFYAVWQADDMKHFALMVGGEVITPYEIENYGCPCNDAIPLYADGKSGLLAYGCGIVYVKPEYDEVYDEGFDSDFIFVKDGKKGRITLEDHRYITDEEFASLSEDEQDVLHDAGFICSYDDC